MKSIVARSGYLLVLSGTVALGLLLALRGVAPELTSSASFLGALFATSALERIAPRRADWHPTRAELGGDALFLALGVVTQRAVHGLVAVIATTALARALPRPLLSAPQPALAAVAFLAGDLAKYLLHRAAHENRWLWRFHAAHHAPARMYAANGIRLHPANLAWNVLPDLIFAGLLGLEPRWLAVIASVRSAIGVLQHANFVTAPSVLDRVLSTPNLHQWHHSIVLAEANANYGSALIVWDALFGTRTLPAGTPPVLGIREPHPRGIVGQLARPFSCRTP
jgi:sterol desaturase/sphingolipid hydroxylase (fatty acid hydroxylase superfamily)